MRRRATIIRAITMIAMMIHRGSIGRPTPPPVPAAVVNVAVYAAAKSRPGLQASFAAVETVRVYRET
jgi:hypothetical protein